MIPHHLLLVTAEYCKAQDKQLSRAEKAPISPLPTSNLTEPWKDLQAVVVSERRRRKKSGRESYTRKLHCVLPQKHLYLSIHLAEAPDLTLALLPALLLLHQLSLVTEKLWGHSR